MQPVLGYGRPTPRRPRDPLSRRAVKVGLDRIPLRSERMSTVSPVIIYYSDVNKGEGDPLMLLPRPDQGVAAAEPPGTGPGFWSGAPCAVAGDGEIFLAYRLRRPIGQGRGYAVAVARSVDGEQFDTVLTIGKEDMATESLERPALVRTPEGRWRLYLSCATTGTKHWRVEMTEAAHPTEFDPRDRETVLPGDAKTGVKDPVIVHHRGQWHLWASCHPLDDPLQTDQMTTE